MCNDSWLHNSVSPEPIFSGFFPLKYPLFLVTLTSDHLCLSVTFHSTSSYFDCFLWSFLYLCTTFCVSDHSLSRNISSLQLFSLCVFNFIQQFTLDPFFFIHVLGTPSLKFLLLENFHTPASIFFRCNLSTDLNLLWPHLLCVSPFCRPLSHLQGHHLPVEPILLSLRPPFFFFSVVS